jgi:3-dehydrosphinganine reductase
MSGPAFITGGSSGIGLELARALAKRGHPIALFARNAGRLEDAVRVLKAEVPDAMILAFPTDVGDRAQVTQAVQTAISHLGAPAWAIANAGFAEPGEFLSQALDAHEMQMRTNYMGALYFAHAVAPAMAAQDSNPGGKLVFVSSGAAFFGIYGYSAYAPSKFALRGLAEVLRVELKPRNISVTLAYPPDTETPSLAAEAATKPAATREITASGGVWSAADVAALIIKRAAKGRFTVAPGAQMRALLALHSILAPALRFWQGTIVRKHTR